MLASTHGVAGLPPGAERLLALDACRPRAPVRAERRLGVGHGSTRRWRRDMSRGNVAVYVDLLSARRISRRSPTRRSWTLNSLGGLVDRAVPSLRAPIPGSLFLNYHVVADKRNDSSFGDWRRGLHRLEPRPGAARARRPRSRARQLLDRQPRQSRRTSTSRSSRASCGATSASMPPSAGRISSSTRARCRRYRDRCRTH